MLDVALLVTGTRVCVRYRKYTVDNWIVKYGVVREIYSQQKGHIAGFRVEWDQDQYGSLKRICRAIFHFLVGPNLSSHTHYVSISDIDGRYLDVYICDGKTETH